MMSNIGRIQGVLEGFKESLIFSSAPIKVAKKADALIAYGPNMQDVAEEVLLLIKLGWCGAEHDSTLRRKIETSFELFHRNIVRCNPELIPKLSYNADLDLVPLGDEELRKMHKLVSIHFVTGEADAVNRFQRDLIVVKHLDPVRAQYFRGVAYNEGKPLFFENSFAYSITSWSEVTIDTTANAAEVLLMLDNKFRPKKETIEYVENHYKTHTLLAQDNETELKDNLSELLYNTRSEIVTMKTSIGKGCRDPLGRKDALRIFGEDKYKVYRDFSDKGLNHILNAYQNYIARYTIIDLHVATWILGQLSDNPFVKPPEEIGGKIEKIGEFLASCLSSYYKGTKRVPNLIPNTSSPCLAACFFIYKIAENFEIDISDFNEARSKIIEYVINCQREKGFSGGLDEPEDLVHTCLGLQFYKANNVLKHGSKELKKLYNGVKNLISSCFNKNEGGYSISPDLPPSAHGTRFALQIQENFTETKINDGEIKIADFIHRLYDKKTGGYRGVTA